MKMFYSVAITAITIFAGSLASAEDVPSADLGKLGLSELQPMTSTEGQLVRGQSAAAGGSGLSLVAFAIFDPNTGSVFQGSSSAFASSSAENAGLQIPAQAFSPGHAVGLGGPFSVNISTNGQVFSALIDSFTVGGGYSAFAR